MEGLVLLCWACAILVDVHSLPPQTPNAVHYLRCNKEQGIFKGTSVIRNMTSPRLRCFEACSADDTCRSVNVCPSSQTTGQWDCELLDSYSPWFCRRLDTATNPMCFHAEKSSHCLNGGRVRDDGTCKCALCLKGQHCSQHVRDCQEAVEVLAADGGHDESAMCAVQPSTSPMPFLVNCPFNGNNSTRLIYRVQTDTGWSQLDWKTFQWNDYKKGMGSFDIYNFFVGLENMYHFLAQAKYRLNMFNTYYLDPKPADIKQVSYKNITLRNEAGRYALSYDWYSTGDNSDSNDYNVTKFESFGGPGVSHPFYTKDSDCSACAETKGPGWYYVNETGSCMGNSPFAIVAQWPHGDDGLLTIHSTEYPMERIGDFY